jgi:hypothetical protein
VFSQGRRGKLVDPPGVIFSVRTKYKRLVRKWIKTRIFLIQAVRAIRSLRITQRRPRVYFLIYLALIPFFGLIYWAPLAHTLYAPYSRTEMLFYNDQREWRQELQNSLDYAVNGNERESIITDHLSIKLKDLRIVWVELTDDHDFRFQLEFPASYAQGFGNGNVIVGSWIRLNHLAFTTDRWVYKNIVSYGDPSLTHDGGIYGAIRPEQRRDLALLKADLLEVFQALQFGPDGLSGPNYAYFAISKRADRLEYLHRLASEGDPSYMNGSLWRMMYFSATTITTLGIGDVVPISTLARITVGAESISGIILIGLFLNSLANKIRN